MMNAITGEGQIDIHHNNDAIIESEIMLEQTGAVKIEVHFQMNLDHHHYYYYYCVRTL